MAQYEYDAWGKHIRITDGSGNDVSNNETHIANINPFRYRGYYFDVETGWYYLNARYYDPNVGRFISPDCYVSTGQGLLGHNMFAYCNNNPVNMIDNSGYWPQWLKDAANWVDKNIIQPVKEFFEDVSEDIENYDSSNESEEVVFSSNYFSSYKGKLVIKTPFDASFSFGIIGLSKLQQNSETLNHEYGHALQFDKMGVIDYTLDVAIPSVTINLLQRSGKLKYDYYGAPWEAEADLLGGVKRLNNNRLWPEGAYNSYYDLIKMFWE